MSVRLGMGVDMRETAPDEERPDGVGHLEGSAQSVRRLPRLASEWLASEEELEMLQSSPAVDVL